MSIVYKIYMAQLDLFSYSEQYFLVSTTFWLFYIGCTTLFIVPFIEVMKIRRLVSSSIYINDAEVFEKPFFILIEPADEYSKRRLFF